MHLVWYRNSIDNVRYEKNTMMNWSFYEGIRIYEVNVIVRDSSGRVSEEQRFLARAHQ